jgi:hypothetical protein
MNSFFQRVFEKPIFILLAANIIVGLFIFRDYGYSWDEPLFYDYGNALGYAYSPSAWLSGHFDVRNSYGSSGDDHKTRGPAYLLVSREPVYLFEVFGLDQASAWHLVNFLCFQLGVYFLYRLSMRWVKPIAALATSAVFAWQPMLWGHAFINPKDLPFLTFFLASVCLGFEMVDRLHQDGKPKLSTVFFPAIVLGMTTSIRVLGPLAGLLVFIYFLVRFSRDGLREGRTWFAFVLYGLIAVVTMFITWPYLWEKPIARFLDVFRYMSDNPTNLSVLFGGQVYRAGDLPRRYLPFMLVTTLTEPVWILFAIGIITSYWKLVKQNTGRGTQGGRNGYRGDRSVFDSSIVSLTLVLLWFLILVAYVLIRQPAMYDGIRHFLFILPPVFVFIGFAFEAILDRNSNYWLRAVLFGLFLLPGVQAIVHLHPYEYTYYNSFIGGTNNAFRNYETDYWLTCYKDAVQELNSMHETATLYVHRESYIAGYYASKNIAVKELRGAANEIHGGDYVLVNTRTNEDRRILKDVAPLIQIQRGKALFCTIKRVP